MTRTESKPRIYLETTIPSYFAALPSRDIVTAARQELTRLWWENKRTGFELFISQAVLDEISLGDPVVASRRKELLTGIPILADTRECHLLAGELFKAVSLPERARLDVVHIALAIFHRQDFLLTWNCAHIANAFIRKRIQDICLEKGLLCPVICTPEEILEEINGR